MTGDVHAPELALPPQQIADLLQVLAKGLRASQLYLPNNPVYQRAIGNLQAAFREVWDVADDLVLDVGEVELMWEGQEVYRQDQRSESIAWTLFKDGVRSVTFRKGAEDAEVVRFLSVINRSRTLQPDAADDLLTLLWEEDFQHIAYTFRELASEGEAPLEVEGETEARDPTVVQQAVQEEAPSAAGLISIDDFDVTLYFLDEREVEYLHREVDREYAQDLRHNVLSMLFDLLELQTFSTVRAELISIVENFIPYLLSAADFRSVAFILREIRVVLQRARELLPEQRVALRALPGRLSEPEALSQLLQSLDEAAVHPSEEDLGELFSEFQPEALPTLAAWLARLSSERVRQLVRAAAERLARASPEEVVRALESGDPAAQLEMVRMAGRMRLTAATDAIGRLLETAGDRSLKMAVVEALMAIASPSAVRLLERGIDDDERDVRVTAVKFLGFRGHRNAFPRIEAAVVGGKLRRGDLTEKIAFFEAYGALAGAAGISVLERMLLGRGGLLSRREDAGTRACAAMALGKIRTAEARGVLELAVQDREPLVRNAVTRALREVGA